MMNLNELPNLEGSEKQIAWAMQIRSKIVKDIRVFVQNKDSAIKHNVEGKYTSAHVEIWNRDRNNLVNCMGNVSASFWIDNRNIKNIVELIMILRKN